MRATTCVRVARKRATLPAVRSGSDVIAFDAFSAANRFPSRIKSGTGFAGKRYGSGEGDMSADRSKHPIVHFVGSVPLPDAETVFRTLSGAVGRHLVRLPDGETGIRKTWIRFLQEVLAENPAIEFATEVPPYPTPARSRPATPTWRSGPGVCSTVCSRRASSRPR